MKILINRMQRPFPKLNHHPYTLDDVDRIAKRERIKLTICDYNPDILGYYCTRKTPRFTKRFIVINSMLDETGRTFIGLHELAHFYLHVPGSQKQWFYCRRNAELTRSKHDCEADSFALIAMIPFWMLCEFDAVGVAADAQPALVDLLIRRKKLWEKHGV